MASVFLWCTGSGVLSLSSDLLIRLTPDVSGIAVLQTIAVSGFHLILQKDGVLLILLLFFLLIIMHQSLSVLGLRRPAQSG